MKQTFEVECEGDLSLSPGFVGAQLARGLEGWHGPKVTEIKPVSTCVSDDPKAGQIAQSFGYGKEPLRCRVNPPRTLKKPI